MNDLHEADIINALGDIMDTAPQAAERPTMRPATAPMTGMFAEPLAELKRPRVSRLLVAAVLVAGGVSGLALLQGKSPTNLKPSESSTSAAPTTATSADPTVTTAPSPLAKLSAYTGWYFPSYIPDGFEITSIEAGIATANTETTQRWTRSDASGNVTAVLSASSSPAPPPEPTKPPSYNTNVHGNGASVFDSGEGIVVGWEEGGWGFSVRGLSLSETDVLSAAQASTVDVNTGAITLSAAGGFVRVESSPVPANTASLTIGLLRTDGALGGFLSFVTWPAEGEALQTLKTRLVQTYEAGVTIERIGPLDRVVRRQAADEFGPITAVTWIQDGMFLEISGRATTEEVLKMAESVQAVAPERFVAEGRRITERLNARETIDRVTFADGTVVSLKGRGDVPIGLCVEAPVATCRSHSSEASLVGERPLGVFDTFEVNGRVLLLGWYSGADEPTVQPTLNTIPGGAAATSTATLTEMKASNQGRVIEVVVPAGETNLALVVGEVSYGFGAPFSTSLLRY
jgi:hypothetical protein